MQNTLSLDDAAELLGCSPAFVRTMITKGRLEPDTDGQLQRSQVEALAELIAKLKDGGFSAMVSGMAPED
ncbi:helix-turn-helix domain-containing protein [Gilvimarinus algae]|uniref:Helix-turn-helix domain-containing protein n=1 Tax=Gilvimarinus algae TaxID=3058037 RepID=A0ABT8TBN7_9GAMM|nr:helix-turn-helix domain-containing protein [Gilvimarinus sp. SDUM040014]MDO3381366.1 helix-turn-helix domain-containing protein [Gilvimarinus sp. SDUM040014]